MKSCTKLYLLLVLLFHKMITLYLSKKSLALVFVLVYMDNILVTGLNSQACKDIISQLNALFSIKDLGPLHYFLGIEIKRYSFGIFISQMKYILDFFKKAHMDGAKPCTTPFNTSFLDHSSPLLQDST